MLHRIHYSCFERTMHKWVLKEAVMSEGVIQIYYGEGHGKSTAAIGNAIHVASEGKSVIIIQFLKGKDENELAFLNRLEPEIKVFRFAKSDACFEELPESAKQEEIIMSGEG